jgi:hypothetical protein
MIKHIAYIIGGFCVIWFGLSCIYRIDITARNVNNLSTGRYDGFRILPFADYKMLIVRHGQWTQSDFARKFGLPPNEVDASYALSGNITQLVWSPLNWQVRFPEYELAPSVASQYEYDPRARSIIEAMNPIDVLRCYTDQKCVPIPE